MYAVIRTGGKQYRVAPNDVIQVERLSTEPGKSVDFEEVLLVGEGAATTAGTPLVDGAKVRAEVLEEVRGEKIIVFKKKRRLGYRRKQGHRQALTVLRITDITDADGKTVSAAKAKPAVKSKAPDKKPAAKAKPAVKSKAPDKKPAAKAKPKADTSKAAGAEKPKAAPKAKAAPKKKAAGSAAKAGEAKAKATPKAKSTKTAAKSAPKKGRTKEKK